MMFAATDWTGLGTFITAVGGVVVLVLGKVVDVILRLRGQAAQAEQAKTHAEKIEVLTAKVDENTVVTADKGTETKEAVQAVKQAIVGDAIHDSSNR
jgi:hypothetical protein